MDYGHQVQIAELKPKFKGLLANLLAEAFYHEEELLIEPLGDQSEEGEFGHQKAKVPNSYIKPFT